MSSRDVDFVNNRRDVFKDTSLAQSATGNAPNEFDVTEQLDNGSKIYLSDHSDDLVEVYHAPGHTPDSVFVVLKSEKKVFTGDMIYPYVAININSIYSNWHD